MGLSHISLTARAFDAAIADYSALFALAPTRFRRAGQEGARFALLGIALEILAGETDDGAGLNAIALTVRDLDSALHTLSRRGITCSAIETLDGDGAPRFARADTQATHGMPLVFVEGTSAQDSKPGAAIAGLDHVVINTPHIERALALYGARLGLDLRLERRSEQWGTHFLFFRCGSGVIEIASRLGASASEAQDRFGGLAWRMRDGRETHARLERAGFELSPLRPGRKPGTHVFTVKSRTAGVPTLMLEAE